MEPNDQELSFYSKHTKDKNPSVNDLQETIKRLEQKIQLFQGELNRLKDVQKKR
uniref:Uncharacterized protein n=1 Tax=viral metagenome TaxID=1070528 RepID=A0A6C0L3G3_9ZZZZ|tara:strand:- start:2174 stop:2335 length:162 start_codon:yes stop_codon:yes gene_type:complete